MVLGGCVDDQPTPLASSAPRQQSENSAASPAALRPEFDIPPRFDLAVEATGALKPGHPIHLTLHASANFPTADGELRLTLPEVAAAENGGWAVVVTPTNEEIRPHIRVRKPFKTGDVVRERVTLSIPEPGYYHVMATAYQHRDTARIEAPTAGDVSRRDFWLWVDENGGRLTTSFDTTLFGIEDRKQSGPRGSQKKPPRVRSGDANITCALLPAGTQETVILTSGCPSGPPVGGTGTATATFKATYADASAAGIYRPVGDAQYIYTVRSKTTNATLASGRGFTNANGEVGVIDCTGPTDDRLISIDIYALNSRANILYNGSERAGSYTGTCGGHNKIRLDPEMAHLFLSVVKVYEAHRVHFSFYSERIYVRLTDENRTYYEPATGDIYITKRPERIYGENAVMYVTHEYGHRFHDKKLFIAPATNGLARYMSGCPDPHPLESSSSLGCAIGEAFADWYAAVLRPAELPTWYRVMQTNWYYKNCVPNVNLGILCSDDGARVQGAVGALLLDLTDSDTEAHDRITTTPANVADALRTCLVQVGGTTIAYTGIDHVIWCMENRSPYQVRLRAPGSSTDVVYTFFNSRAQNRWATSTTGTQLFASNSDSFRKLWLADLYSLRPHVTESPTLSPNFYVVPAPPEPVCEPSLQLCEPEIQ